MANLIETLSDDSQILLLYLTDELPDEDRKAIQRRLVVEPVLGEQLEQLRSIYSLIGARLQNADEFGGYPINASATARSIGRQMRQRLAEPRPVAPVRKQVARSRLRPWLIPSAVAAAILVASALWISRGGNFEPNKQVGIVGPTTTTTPAGDDNLELFKDSFTSPSPQIADVLNGGASQRDLSMQDDVSPYLLKVGTVQE